jgi:uncharacterized membrane protein
MIFLILGMLLWSGAHLFPSLGAAQRAALIERMGEGPYKGLFTLSLVGAIALMVLGWRSTAPVAVYAPPAPGGLLTNVAVFVALVLFMGSNVPTNIKRFVRHPQLTGMAVWALAHLLANGDQRSLVLFAGLGLWAVVTMLSINRRDGEWQKPEPLPLAAEIKPLVAGVVGFGILVFLHPYIAGVRALPGW